MDPDTLRKDFTCRLCGRLPDTDIVMAEDGFFYHRECMSANSEKTKNFISPKTIKCLIEKLSDDGTSDLGASQINDEKSGGESSCNDAADLSAADLLAQRGYNTYFGCNNTTKNQSLGIELLLKAANEGSAFASYKICSIYSAGVHGFKVDTKRAKRYLTLAKELSTRSGSLAPSELENIESYLDKL